MLNGAVTTGRVWRRLRQLPLRARVCGAALLCAAFVPAAAAVAAAVRGPDGGIPSPTRILDVVASCVAVAAVLAFDPPRSASPLAYARQLRARFLELQSTFDADDRRRPEEKEDDRVPSDP